MKKENIVEFLNELNSNCESKEFAMFLDTFKQLVDFLEPYITQDGNNEYKLLDKKQHKTLNKLFQNIQNTSKEFLKLKPKNEIDKLRKEIIEKLNKDFISKIYQHFKSPEFKKQPTFKKIMDNQKKEVEYNNKETDLDSQYIKSVLTYFLTDKKDLRQKNKPIKEMFFNIFKSKTKKEMENKQKQNDKKVINYICSVAINKNNINTSKEQQRKLTTRTEDEIKQNKEAEVLPISIMAGGYIISQQMAKRISILDDILIASTLICFGLSLKIIQTVVENMRVVKDGIKQAAGVLTNKQTEISKISKIEKINVDLEENNLKNEKLNKENNITLNNNLSSSKNNYERVNVELQEEALNEIKTNSQNREQTKQKNLKLNKEKNLKK